MPMPESFVEGLKELRKRLGAISGWIFAGERRPDQPMDRHLFDKWLHVAEKKAKLAKLTCYQQPDADTLLAVMSEPKKMRDAALASGWRGGATP